MKKFETPQTSNEHREDALLTNCMFWRWHFQQALLQFVRMLIHTHTHTHKNIYAAGAHLFTCTYAQVHIPECVRARLFIVRMLCFGHISAIYWVFFKNKILAFLNIFFPLKYSWQIKQRPSEHLDTRKERTIGPLGCFFLMPMKKIWISNSNNLGILDFNTVDESAVVLEPYLMSLCKHNCLLSSKNFKKQINKRLHLQ